MHSTLGRSPDATSYSKSHTTMVPKLLLTWLVWHQSGAAVRGDLHDRSCARGKSFRSDHRAIVLASWVRGMRRDHEPNQFYRLRRLLPSGWLPAPMSSWLSRKRAGYWRSSYCLHFASGYGRGRIRQNVWLRAPSGNLRFSRSANNAWPSLL